MIKLLHCILHTTFTEHLDAESKQDQCLERTFALLPHQMLYVNLYQLLLTVEENYMIS